MRSVKLTSTQGDHVAGDVIELDDASAEFLVEHRFAVEPDDELPVAAGTRTQDEVIHPTLEPADDDPEQLVSSTGEPIKDVDSDERERVIPNSGEMAPDPSVADPRETGGDNVDTVVEPDPNDDADGYNPGEHKVADVNAYLEEQRQAGNDDEVARVRQLETEGRGRAGILDD